MVLIKTSTFPRLQTSVSITSSHGVVSWHSPQPQSLPQIPASIFTAQQVVAASSLHCSRQSSRSEPSLPGRKNQGRLWATQKPGNTGVMRDKHTNSQRKDLDDKKSWQEKECLLGWRYPHHMCKNTNHFMRPWFTSHRERRLKEICPPTEEFLGFQANDSSSFIGEVREKDCNPNASRPWR